MPSQKRGNAKAGHTDQGQELELPPGVRLLWALDGHQGHVKGIAFDPAGRTLASGGEDGRVLLWDLQSGELLGALGQIGSAILSLAFDPAGQVLATGSRDNTVKLWDLGSGHRLRSLDGHTGEVSSLAFDPEGGFVASGSADGTVKLWEPRSGRLERTMKGNQHRVWSVAVDPLERTVATGGSDGTVKLWNPRDGELIRSLERKRSPVYGVAFDLAGRVLACGGANYQIELWDPHDGKLLRVLEGHTSAVTRIAFSHQGDLLASKSDDHTVRLWRSDTGEPLAVIPTPTRETWWIPALAFHAPLLAAAGSEPETSELERCLQIHLYELELDILLSKRQDTGPRPQAVHYTTGKIVLVGDSGVGKTGLGWRLAHGEYKEHSSTHGQQFWVFPELRKKRADGTECDAILWDLAGQPDYRLIHALFLDDADLALVLFDPTDTRDPLHGVEFWLKHLGTQAGDLKQQCPVVLVAARADRGAPTLTQEELEAYVRERGLAGWVTTSAKEGEGLSELLERMKALILWDDKPATVTTTTFRRIRDYVLGLKEVEAGKQVLVSPEGLRCRLEATDVSWEFTDAEMLTAVGHLENYGWIRRLRTSKGERRILLVPELLNNLASSFVLEARRNPKGLGSLEEKRLLVGDYPFPEIATLTAEERTILLDSAALLFLEHNVCFRETDPLRMEPYLVFPELINLKKPLEEDHPTEDGAAYTVSGATANVFASLVVLLGYTHTFTRTNQWQNHARYEVGDGLVCGFRQDGEREAELDFVLYFGLAVPRPVRTLFQSLFESFLARRNLTVLRVEPVTCSKCGHALDRSVARQRAKEGKTFAFCNDCGERLALRAEEPIQLTQAEQADVDTQRRAADERTRFEQGLFRVKVYVAEQKIEPLECFVSYAWGTTEEEKQHERWVERSLATDLQKAGIDVVLDKWENSKIGASVARFVDRIERSDRVVVVGTPGYREKYENRDPKRGYVVAAEMDLISNRMLGTETEKETVLPVLRAGEKKTSFPPLLHGRVYADFRDAQRYFLTAFDLVLSIYGLPHNHAAVADLRDTLSHDQLHREMH